MVSIKLKFRPSTIDGKEGSLYYQVIYKRVVRQIATHYKIMTNEWNAESDTLRIIDYNERYNYLQSIQRRIQWDKKRLMKIIDRFINSGYDFSVVPRSRACCKAGRSIAARIAMIAITTSNSINVKQAATGDTFFFIPKSSPYL